MRQVLLALVALLPGCGVPSWMHVARPSWFTLGCADTMEKVFRDEPWTRGPAEKLAIEAARNDVEGIQLVVAPTGKDGLRSVTVEVTDLRCGRSTIPKASVTWNVVGYVKTEKPAYKAPRVGWWPDPLLPATPFDVKAGEVQPVWLSVRVPDDARPGLYRGKVTVRAGRLKRSLPIELRVWDFAIPKQQHLETCFLLRPDELQRFYRLKSVPIEMYESWMDFCLDRRICPALYDWTHLERDLERLVARQLDRGGACFGIAYAWPRKGTPEERAKHNEPQITAIRKLYERVKARGWLPKAYVYCHDEVGKEHYDIARELYSALKKAMPGLRLMQTFYKDSPIPALDDCLDIWAPVTGRYRKEEFQAQQAKGDEVWWYVCCGPGKPYANLMIEWPGIDHRILLWQTWKLGVTGFLYWGINVFASNSKGEKRWPEAAWDPATFVNQQGGRHHGDGQLLYPGPDRLPLSSVRLENFRDGLEDYECLWLLRDAVTRLKKAGGHDALVAEAERVLAIDDAVVKDLRQFTQDPQALRAARAALAALIERVHAALERR
ncbi:MAG TPA: glycoside hydrolase domain-containing protein [Planctomycetota bacterium]|nr:glycoside hydrolase domain-containing protein [Planctomycetota bacterium]